MTAPYDCLASVYDRHWGFEFAPWAEEVFKTLLARFVPRNGTVLDLCCGTGLLAAHMERLGYRVFAVDESSRMLELARERTVSAQLQQADMAAFCWDISFDAVVCFYNSVNHARSLDHLRAAVANVARHLKPEGLFLFDYVAREAFESSWETREEMAAEDGASNVRYVYERSRGRATCIVEALGAEISQIPLERDQAHAALAAAGLEVLNEVPAAGVNPAGTRRMILARKVPFGEAA